MKWIKFKIKTITAAEDAIISSLYDIGLEGAQIEDKVPLTALEKEQMFVDILPDAPVDDGVAWLSFFAEEAEAGKISIAAERVAISDMVARITAELEELREFMDIGEGVVTLAETEDLDWINNWKEYFHQFTIDDILVMPSWEEVKAEDNEKILLHIDPGTAFGTGMHETTQLCIRQLRRYVTAGAQILDVGCGSGILSILALLFGAGQAMGTDLDPCAEAAVRENREANGIRPEQFKMLIGNIITDKAVQEAVGEECYDIVVANILAEVLIPLIPVIWRQLKKGGIYITSGIIGNVEGVLSKEAAVVAAMREAGMEVLEIHYQGEWVSVTARK